MSTDQNDKKKFIQSKLDQFNIIYKKWLSLMHKIYGQNVFDDLVNKIEIRYTHYCNYEISDLTKDLTLIDRAETTRNMKNYMKLLSVIIEDNSSDDMVGQDEANAINETLDMYEKKLSSESQ
jgi:hypothetical protein